MDPIKVVIVVVLIAIVASLGSALFHLSRGRTAEDSRKMARSLTIRVGLSVALFGLWKAAWKLGLIKPAGTQ
jgi:cytochrome bd-type quinol oxidase subunit 2